MSVLYSTALCYSQHPVWQSASDHWSPLWRTGVREEALYLSHTCTDAMGCGEDFVVCVWFGFSRLQQKPHHMDGGQVKQQAVSSSALVSIYGCL